MNPTLASPLDFGPTRPAPIGISEAGQRHINEIFKSQLASGLHFGAQLVIARHGRVVFDRAAGIANLRRKNPTTPETPFLVYSVTKTLTALSVHQLVEEGRIDLDAPIARYWPEFGCKGKDSATVRHALLHQAGIPQRGLARQVLLWANWERITRSVARLPAEFPPGTKTAYHIVNYGFILGELVRRVTGERIETRLQRDFMQPLGMRNSYTGLPDSQRARAAGIYYADPLQRGAALLFSLGIVRRLFIPAASLNTTARDLAVFYQMLLNQGQYAGRRYLRPETIAEATTLRYEGYDDTIGLPVRWAMGFHLGGHLTPDETGIQIMGHRSTQRTFGHSGQGGCAFGWADPEADLVFAFTNNCLQGQHQAHARFQALADAVWDALI